MILLTPGPCMTTDSVRASAALPDLNHRDPIFNGIMHDIRQRLLAVHSLDPAEWQPYLLGGSGTAAVEAMLTSCIANGPVLVIENGYYSSRIAQILEVHGIEHIRLSFDWESGIAIGRVESELKARKFEAVLMTHHETTLGLLNPIAEIGRLARASGARLLVDAMSSFGGDEIDFDACDVVCASANKCLRGLAGVGFVLVRSGVPLGTVNRRTYYLHLPMYGTESAPLTLPTAILRAMHQALIEMPPLEARLEENLSLGRFVREELTERDVRWFEPATISSHTISIELSRFGAFDPLFQRCYDAGFVIYGCKEHLREKFFQISWMGAVTEDHLCSLFDCLS